MALTYKDIANRDEFYEWFDNVALPTIYGKSLPYRNLDGNMSLPGTQGTVGTFGKFVGRPRLRQLRSRLRNQCKGLYRNAKANQGICIYPYITKPDDEFYSKISKDDKDRKTSLDWKDMYCDGIGTITGNKEVAR